MARLSISRAWDETKARIAADGRLMMVVALALVALPLLVTGVISPQEAGAEPTITNVILGLVAALIGIVGQLALIRLAIGPAVTVGEAIAHGARRMPIYFVAIVLMILFLLLAAIPLVLILAASGVPLDDGEAAASSPVAILAVLLYIALVIFVAVRIVLSSPVASAERAGPIAILRRSWDLTSGHFWRLLGFLLLFFVGALILISAVNAAVGLVAALIFGPIEPMSASALLVALAAALVNALVTVILAVMLARMYLQLAGDGVETVSVPSSGT